MSYKIAIDGPAGAGKSTIAKIVAAKKNLFYVDTGAMYRAMAVYMIRNGIDKDDEQKVSTASQNALITFGYVDGDQHVYLNGEDVTPYLRDEETGNMASATSKYPAVRQRLTTLQREFAGKNDVVMDGRDIGTVVLPDADLKIFLTASSAVRAQRRFHELRDKGIEADINVIEEEIIQRDMQDMNRPVAPLKKADDAVEIDSSDLTIDGVVEKILECCK